METGYGYKVEGSSKFVIVAPHAAGNDKNTDKIAGLIAQRLDAFLVINTRFRKKTKVKKNEEDFNKLSWNGNQYNWGGKQGEMKKFFDDIKTFSESARNKSRDNKAVIIYIHGLRNTEDIGIDVGVGMKEDGITGELRGATGSNRHPDARKNTGEKRVEKETIIKLRKKLNQMLEARNLRATIGAKKAAWSRQNAVQFHANTTDDSMQFEIVYALRKNDRNIEFTSNILAEALQEVYPTD